MSQVTEKREQKLLEKAAQKELEKEVHASEGHKQPPVKENRTLAKAVLAGAVALSLLVISPVKLSVRHNSVMKSLKAGVTASDTDRVSVKEYVRRAAAESRRMIQYMLPEYRPEEKLGELNKLIDTINSESDEEKLISLNKRLVNLSDEVYGDYVRAYKDATGKDIRDDTTGIYGSHEAAVNSLQRQINRLEYWKDAEKYNADRGSFPASLMGAMYGIDYAPVN